MRFLAALPVLVCLGMSEACHAGFVGKIAYASYPSYTLWVFDTLTQSSQQVPLPVASPTAHNAKMTADGEWIVFSGGAGLNSQIYTVRPDGSGFRRITDGDGDLVDPAVSPCAGRVAYQQVGGDVFVVNFDGTGRTNLGYGIDMLEWSPDGKKLVGADWALGGGYNSDLWIWDLTTFPITKTKITSRPAGAAFVRPAWSPDGSKITAVFAYEGTNYDIVVMNPDGSGLVNLTSDMPSDEHNPAWSPDGQYLFFSSTRDGSQDIWFMRADGSGRTKMISGGGATLVSPAVTFVPGLIFSEDFSTPPGWVTDDAAKLRWDSATGTFHGTQINTEGTYAYIDLPAFKPNKAWRLEWDHRLNSDDWSAGLDFGLMSNLASPDAAVGMGISDGGNYTVLWGLNGVFSPAWQMGAWYHTVLSFDPATQQLTARITNSANGALFMSLSRTVASFPSSTTRLGVSRVFMKNTGPGANPNGTVDYNLDNIRLYGEAAPMIAAATANTTVSPGGVAQLSVNAYGTPALHYQWFHDGQALPACGPNLIIANASFNQAGTYCVVITNGFGALTNCATLSVLDLKMFAGLVLAGPVGTNYKIEYIPTVGGTDTWQTLTNVILTTSPFVFFDMESPNESKRFYRATAQP